MLLLFFAKYAKRIYFFAKKIIMGQKKPSFIEKIAEKLKIIPDLHQDWGEQQCPRS